MLSKTIPSIGPELASCFLNAKNEVFVGQRVDVDNDTWQLPQGGMEPGESSRDAAFRELREEIGTANATIVAESKKWMYYDLPADIAAVAWSGQFRGQRQKWFVMMFNGCDRDINVRTEHPDFPRGDGFPTPNFQSLRSRLSGRSL